MAPAAPWADLHRELLESVAAADGLSLRDHTCLRGVCTAWRSALETPSYPCLLTLADDDNGRHHSASVYSLPMRRSFHLHTASSALDDSRDDRARRVRGRPRVVSRAPVVGRARVVGSSNGRFAVSVDQECTHSMRAAFLSCTTSRIFVIDPRSGKEVELAAPATSIGPCYDHPGYEYVSKVVFAPDPYDGTVVALYDRKNVAYIDITTSRAKWTTIDVISRSGEFLDDLAFGEDGKLYCLASNGAVHVLRIIPGGGGGRIDEKSPVVEPLPTLVCDPDPAAAAFVPPYDVASTLATTKNLFFCHGSLYQVWRNSSATVTSGGFRMSAGETLVLRYDPGRWPCWDRVKDLGGCSVFVGKSNSPAVVRAAGVPGVRADSVYWIDWMRPMVCDIATGTSKPYVLPYGACKGNCWYFGDDDMHGVLYISTATPEKEENKRRMCVVSLEMIVEEYYLT